MLLIRDANENDIPAIESMVADFVKGHPAENHARPSQALRSAYFGERPVAHMLVAERNGQIVGMAQWTLIHDMFWGMFGAGCHLSGKAFQVFAKLDGLPPREIVRSLPARALGLQAAEP